MEQNESILEDINVSETEAPRGLGFLANLIDWVIEIGIIVAFYRFMPRDFILSLLDQNTFMRYLLAFALILTYRLVCILAVGKTIGMAVCKIKYLNKNLEPLSSTERIRAGIGIKMDGIKYYKV